MDYICVHRLFRHLHQRIHRHMKVFRNFMKFNRVDCSCTIHDFAHCLLGDSNSFCQINLLFVFFFQFSLNVVCNYHIYIQHIIASYSCTYIIRSLAKNINHLETIFNSRNILFLFQLQKQEWRLLLGNHHSALYRIFNFSGFSPAAVAVGADFSVFALPT